MLSDDVVNGSLKAGYSVRDSKRNSAKLIEFTVSLERRVCFFFTSDGYLVVVAFQIQGTIVSETRHLVHLVDQIIHSQEGVGIEVRESVDRLAVIHH